MADGLLMVVMLVRFRGGPPLHKGANPIQIVFLLAFLLAVAVVEKASASATFCTFEDGVPVCFDDIDPDGPA